MAWHNKEAEDDKFHKFFPVINRGATDNRNFVKKAVSWVASNIIRELESEAVKRRLKKRAAAPSA